MGEERAPVLPICATGARAEEEEMAAARPTVRRAVLVVAAWAEYQ